MRIIATLSLLLLFGCVTPSTILVNEKGQTIRCSAYGYGMMGIAVAEKIHE